MSVLVLATQPNNMEAVMDDEFVSVDEAAKMLGMSSRTVSRWVKQGYFPNAQKKNPFAARGSAYEIPKSDIEVFLDKRKTQFNE